MTPHLSPAGRAAFAAACLIPLLTALAWAYSLLSYTISLPRLASGLLAGIALALLAAIAASVAVGPHRRRLGAAILLSIAAFLLPVATLSPPAAATAAGSALVCWLVLLAGAGIVQAIPDWFAGMRSHAAGLTAHVLAMAVDLLTFGGVAAVCGAPIGGPVSNRIAAAAVVLGPLVLLRAAWRHQAIGDAVFGDALLVEIVWVDSGQPGPGGAHRAYDASTQVPGQEGGA